MEKITLGDLNILDIGDSINISGVIMSSVTADYLFYLPEDQPNEKQVIVDMNAADWEKFIRQTDLMETEILAKSSDGKLAKIIVRKSQRQIEAGISWRVYKRDNYTCRYCGKDGIPMTVDHVIPWESGGPTTYENLVTSCRKCNKAKTNSSYEDWLKGWYYSKASDLSPEVKQLNKDLLTTLGSIPRYETRRSR